LQKQYILSEFFKIYRFADGKYVFGVLPDYRQPRNIILKPALAMNNSFIFLSASKTAP
jgi:hypothetical protein